ncbi:NOL7 protein, partial [Polypterus senegalus]
MVKMVKKRRGVAVNTNEITMEDKTPEESSDEDDGPEEVAFETAREDAEKRRRDVAAFIKRDKEQQKEKRRKRQELFSEQKKQKCISEEVLKEVESSEASKTNDDPNSEEQEDDQGQESEDEDLEVHEAPVRYNAVRLADHTQADSQQESAKDFIRARLYGRSSRTAVQQDHK